MSEALIAVGTFCYAMGLLTGLCLWAAHAADVRVKRVLRRLAAVRDPQQGERG